jgi:hypothetical protein
MKRPHLLAVAVGPVELGELWVALREAGMRAGWLEWNPASSLPQGGPLAEATATGALRAVEIHADGAIARKPRRGPANLDDVLREQFLGCAVVFVRGPVPTRPEEPTIPKLEPSGAHWRIAAGDESKTLDTAALISRLRSPKAL